MFKTFYSYFALFMFTLYALSSPIIWASYFAYQEYIASTFCVNKQLPICNGTCFINTVIEEEPSPALPKIEVRTPEIAPAVIEQLKVRYTAVVTPTRYYPHRPPSLLHGIQPTLLKPPKHHVFDILSI
jgi:hypothetical protein